VSAAAISLYNAAMIETASLLETLRQTSQPAIVDAIERLVRDAPDRMLNRINALAFAAQEGLDEEQTIAAFLHGSRLGLFELSWNVLCSSCGGVLGANSTLKTVKESQYTCKLCVIDHEATLDDKIDVTFTISPRVRSISAHDPHRLSPEEYLRQVYWSSGVDLPEDDWDKALSGFILDMLELPASEKGTISLALPEGFAFIFEPVTDAVQFIDVKGEPTKERRSLSVLYDRSSNPGETIVLQPGPLRIQVENRSDVRALPSVCLANEAMHALVGKRRPYLTAKRLLSNQTFRDIYRTDTLDADQRLKIMSLTFLFTDLRGSTALYERVGDLAAFDLVRAHFRALHEIVAADAGAVVKTIGDAVMATFPTPDRAVSAAIRMREAMRRLNEERGSEDLLLKIGIHEGPCIAVNLNERQDYFGQTVNIASRVQNLATAQEIYASGAVLSDPTASTLLAERGVQVMSKNVALRGIANEVTIFTIP
jgi:class 3 adenylate cyclase